MTSPTPAVAELEALVSCESPSDDLEGLHRCAALVADLSRRRLGEDPERIEVDGYPHLRWHFGRPRVLLLGHFDTVWPRGTLDGWPFSVEGDRATGPGVFDMKAGVVQIFDALAGRDDLEGVSVLLTSDEETGSRTSRALIEEAAAGLEAVLVLEPSAGGALKIARKGVGSFRMNIAGRAAHAGLEPHKGINATVEAAHQVLAIAALADPERATTVTPTVMSSGTTVNTVPEAASLTVDVRATTVAEMQRVQHALDNLGPALAGSRVAVEPISVRPPLEEAASAGLFARAQRLAEALGLSPLEGVSVGGGSDGNFTAALGVPTLDGLGAVGDNAHAPGEWAHLPALAERTRLLGALLDDLLGTSR